MKKMTRKYFSLLELLIVIAIMGALAALILPHFTTSESAAKDVVCDYNQAGTVRYINMFNTANGAYPTGFHTGLNTPAGEMISLAEFGTQPTYANLLASPASVLTEGEVESLAKAGITKLAYGKGNVNLTTITVTPGAEQDDPAVVNAAVCKITTATPWYEVYGTINETTGAGSDGRADSILKINGKTFAEYLTAKPGILVPFLAAPTIEWEKAYVNGETEVKSKIEVPLVGKCPWPEDGSMKYYICLFWVDSTGKEPAKLVSSACPECGVLNLNSF